MGAKGCWTCRARKVKCDLHQPACGNCTKSQKSCRGYGIQLSWPRKGDDRRSLKYDAEPLGRASRRRRNGHVVFLNTSHWDVSLSDTLEQRRDIAHYLHTLRVPHLPYLPSSQFKGNDAALFQFFDESRCQLLTPVVDESLARFIMRVALSDSSFTSNLVLEGIFTIASLQLQGMSKSVARQHRLVSMLRDNVMQIDKENVLRNLIATMLLYQYEICTTTSPDKCWTVYLCGAKKIIDASSTTIELYKDESAVLMDWIYYHEVVSEFSIRHWAEAAAVDSFCKGPLAIRPKDTPFGGCETSSTITCPKDVLDLLRIICKRPSVYDDDDLSYDESDVSQIHKLKGTIEEAVGDQGTFHDIPEVSSTRQGMLAYLYRCAALLYLNRTVLKVSSTSFQHKRLVREGILVLVNLGFCESAWPMLILACETNEDEQRLQVLQTLARTRQESPHRSSHVPLIQRMIEAIWNQNDLGCDSGVDYCRTLHAVISTAPALPLFA